MQSKKTVKEKNDPTKIGDYIQTHKTEVIFMKTMKKGLSLLLCAIMVATTFFCALPALFVEVNAAEGDITIGGITQTRVVENYETTYAGYQSRFFTGADSNKPTNFVIPGLAEKDNYTPQGMTYWAAKGWILISAYYNGTGKPSLLYALDAKTTKMVAVYTLYNQDGSINTSHGGGIAASEYNLYYADSGSNVAYIPLSELDVPEGTAKGIDIKGQIDLSGELNNVATSYVCYADGVLWTGNFYWSGDDNYKATWSGDYPSVLIGYKLKGNSSEEEWANLQNTNLIQYNKTTNATNGALTYTVADNEHGYIDLTNTTNTTGSSELIYSFGSVYLKHGTKYVLEFDQNGDFASNDFYLLRDGGTGSYTNFKYAYTGGVMTKTNNGDGTYHYKVEFTPGTAVVGNADSNWGNGSDASGTYTVRFDNDTYTAGVTNKITNLRIYEADKIGDSTKRDGYDRAGNPSYVVPFNNDLDRLQYGMVYDGKIYLSRSWSRSESTNHIRELCVGDFDINVPGQTTLTVNGRSRGCTVVEYGNVTKFGGGTNNSKKTEMFFMSEALCIIDDYLYMFAESAAWNYNGANSSNKCPEPIDVIWKIDQKAIMGETRHTDTTVTDYYEKVNSLSEITAGEEYLIVHETSQIDPETGKNIIYAVDSFGGYGDRKLPKQDAGTRANTGDSMGVIGYKISDYTLDGNKLYVTEEADKRDSIHWNIEGAGTSSMRIINKSNYYSKNQYLYFGSRLFAMTTSARTNLNRITLEQYDSNGNFRFYYNGDNKYYLWCNDGSNQSVVDTYTAYYLNHGVTVYIPNYNEQTEQEGTFHADGEYLHTDTGNLLGKSVGTDMQMIQIYKRVANPYSSTEYSQLYTNMDAELQADGTYTVNFETYAVNNSQFKRVTDTTKPTDYILLLDASNSIGTNTNKDTIAYKRWGETNTLSLKNAAGTSDAGDRSTKTYTGGNIYYQHSDGVFCKFNVDTADAGTSGSIFNKKYYEYIWLYYNHPNGTTYWYNPNTNSFQTTRPSESETIKIEGGNDSTRAGRTIYTGVHYSLESDGRIHTLRNVANTLTYRIAAENSANRIAVCQYGSGSAATGYDCSGMYTNASTSIVNYNGSGNISASNYQNAFYSAANFGSVRTIINNLPTSSNNDYTYASNGFEIANEIIRNRTDTTRNLCVIHITDAGLGKDITAAVTMANNAIAASHTTKGLGASVYTVQLYNGRSMNGFTFDSYTNAVSSNYLDAKSIGNLGLKNDVSDTDYVIHVPAGSGEYDPFATATTIQNASILDRKNEAITLDTSSVIKQVLTDAFVIPDNPTITVKYAPSAVDGLENVYFKDAVDASGVTATYDSSAKTITATGYDYTTNYVSSTHEGNKLIVSISGVTANVDNAYLSDTNISDGSKTAVYESANGDAVKYYPNSRISIKEYTFVHDFALPMRNSINGTPLSVDALPQKQTSYKMAYSTDDVDVNINSGDLVYQLKSPDAADMQSKGYVLLQRPNGDYEWVRVNIVPASNVLYEESYFNHTGSSWTATGTPADSYQTLSAKGDVYGYDAAYNNDNIYSNGSALKATVSSTNNRSDTASFEYTGTGFDLISACGPNTGIQIVTVRKDSAIEKVFIVDTYYNDSTYGTLYQVPIVSYRGDYGTYTVETTAAYLSFANGITGASTASYSARMLNASAMTVSEPTAAELLAQVGMEELADENVELIWMDDNSILNGGTGAQGTGARAFARARAYAAANSSVTLDNYIDGFRVYQPLENDSAYIASESNAKYYNIINALNDGDSGITGDSNWVAYVEGGADNTYTFGEYEANGGPTNEIYLSEGTNNGLTFNVSVTNPNAKIMISLRAASGAPTISINGKSDTIITATEMYYDITNIVTNPDNPGQITVTVKNLGGGLLALNNIKLIQSDTAALSDDAITEVAALMSMESTPVSYELLNTPMYFSLRPVRSESSEDTPTDPDNSEDSVTTFIKEFFEKLTAFVQKILAFFERIFNPDSGV